MRNAVGSWNGLCTGNRLYGMIEASNYDTVVNVSHSLGAIFNNAAMSPEARTPN